MRGSTLACILLVWSLESLHVAVVWILFVLYRTRAAVWILSPCTEHELRLGMDNYSRLQNRASAPNA